MIYHPFDGREIARFESFSPQAIDACMYDGAALVSGVLGVDETTRLQRIPKVPSLLSHESKAPSLQHLFDMLDVEDIDSPGLIRIGDVVELPASNRIVSHLDEGVRFGFSALIPTEGADALFMVSEEEFDADSQDVSAGRYGVGDVMLLRQGIEIYKGKKLNLPQMWHVGISPVLRQLITVDIEIPKLQLVRSLPATTATTASTAARESAAPKAA